MDMSTASLNPSRNVTLTKCGKTGIMRRGEARDYESIMNILHMVTRSPMRHETGDVEAIFNNPSFFCFVVEIDGVIVAYTGLYVLRHLGRASFGRVEHFIVAPEYRRNSLCRELMSMVKDTAKELGCDQIDLTVENPAAKASYVKDGFQHIETEVMRAKLNIEF